MCIVSKFDIPNLAQRQIEAKSIQRLSPSAEQLALRREVFAEIDRER